MNDQNWLRWIWKLKFRNLYGRKADLSDVSKAAKMEEKKNALANIDINNYASMVIVFISCPYIL